MKKTITLLFFSYCLSTTLLFSQTTIWAEDFQSYADNTITSSKWSLAAPDVNGADPDDYFKVLSGEMRARDTNAKEQVFSTAIVDISLYTNVSLSVNVFQVGGTMESVDYINIYYKLNGGAETPFSNGSNSDDFSPVTATASALNGSTIQIIIRVKNGDQEAEIYGFDNILVQGTLSCTATGNILLERYDGVSGTSIANLIAAPNYPNSPTATSFPTDFEAPTNIANNYGVRMRGTICAPETGTYYFWVAGDDNVELNLSTDNTETNKVRIAYHNNWTNSRQWDSYPTQKSASITLTAGQSYYIEALMKEGGGDDNLAVGWRTPSVGNAALPTEVIPGSYLSPPTLTPEIDIQGNAISIPSGDITPSITDNTDFGTINLGSSLTKTFTIKNTGNADLTISSASSSDATFTISSLPTTVAKYGGTATFTVTGKPTSVGTFPAIITIANNDSNENPYTFTVKIIGEKVFFDSDGDGIFDNIDIDDDNDGIRDDVEELSCRKSSVAGKATYKFLNETFGTLVPGARNTIPSTNYCYEPGTGSGSSCGTSWILDDGEYVVVSRITGPTASESIHGNDAWTNSLDHTPDDGLTGGMAVFNAALPPGIFYETIITGVLPNVPISYNFWVLNIMAKSTYPNSILPNVTVQFLDLAGNILASIPTNQIGRCSSNVSDNTCDQSIWQNFWRDDINLGNVDKFIVRFINNAPGGGGNDLALDDIVISQTLCDTDSDGVADIFDLDSDNDGIPDVVEAGLGNLSEGTAKISYTSGWVDLNKNGMHDSAESNIPLDTDGDGVPNYLDLDSDNDSIFDVDESGVVSSDLNAPPGLQNGDGDINGDGVGDGTDSDAFRETDIDSNGTLEYFTDGILDIYDYFNGTTFASAYGNISQGAPNLAFPAAAFLKDTDNDGIPDYMDVKSNGTTFDIAGTLYSNQNQLLAGLPVLDANNDGIIDGNTDTDGDGILDAFDNDIAVFGDYAFGSPRDLNRKLELYFDGRNDYVEEEGTDIVNGLSAGTMMAWVKLDPTFVGSGSIMGQNNFWLRINSSKRFSIEINGTTFTSPASTSLTPNIWTHIAAVYDGSNTNATIKLYINGEKVDSTNTSVMRPIIKTSTNTKFRIGRRAASLTLDTGEMFKGYLDEVRVFNKALTADELHKMVYQEIEKNGSNVRGAVIPRDITNYVNTTTTPVALPWANLTRYFRMDVYKDDIIDDLTTPTIDVGTGAKIYNMKIIKPQTAPLPFITDKGDTTIDNAVNIPARGIKGTDATRYDWSIVKIEHKNITYSANQKHLGLFVNKLDASSNPIEFSIQGDTELNVSWYLKLDGFIDLEGESQLVQGDDSMLEPTSSGYIERDQQGQKNSFNYNYWSSPVTRQGAANNAPYILPDVLRDGTTPSNPIPINFGDGAYFADTPNVGAIKITSRWIWTYNAPTPDSNSDWANYYQWINVGYWDPIKVGDGFSMKGTGGVAAINATQNYVFTGKPNSGTISLGLAENQTYLIGNPYPSALDADEFIKDNIKETFNTIEGTKVGRNTVNVFNGALYFWDHFGLSNNHLLAGYEAGYATYNLMGGVVAIADVPLTSQTGSGSKVPERYIPVGQGFFVDAAIDLKLLGTPVSDFPGGTLVFKNSQRIFKREIVTTSNSGSVFMKTAVSKKSETQETDTDTDLRAKIRLTFDSPMGYRRPLLVGVDENASNQFDIGYDAPLNEENQEDMFWQLGKGKLVIQGVNNFNKDQELPLGLKISKAGLATIKIEKLENMDENLILFIKDKFTGKTHNISQNPFEIELEPGEYLDRFALVFKTFELMDNDVESGTLVVDPIIEDNNYHVFMNNAIAELQIKNKGTDEIQSIVLYNYLGQTMKIWKKDLNRRIISLPVKSATGIYMVQINTTNGQVVKKVMME